MKLVRLNEIEQYVLAKGMASLDELCEMFKISKNTIRRDLDELVRRGNVTKVYGGVAANTEHELVPLPVRSGLNMSAKYHIGQLAGEFVHDGDIIFIDSGSTTMQLVPFASRRKKVTIITHSLPVMSEAAKYEGFNVISLGGIYSHPTSSFVGISALESLKGINISKAFMAATGVTIDSGMMNTTYFEAEIKKGIVARSSEIILMADSSKIGRKAVITVCPLDRISTFITNECPPPDYMRFFEEKGIKAVY